MGSNLMMRHSLTVFFFFLSTLWLDEIGSTETGNLYRKMCQNFKDCNSGETLLVCENSICQCKSIQYYEESLKQCVSFLDNRCDLGEQQDGLPKLICGPTASCVRPRQEAYNSPNIGKCICSKNRERTLDGKCAERVTIAQTPAPRISHPNFAPPPETREQNQLKPVEEKNPPPFPFDNKEQDPGVKSDSNSFRTNVAYSLLLPAILSVFLTTI